MPTYIAGEKYNSLTGYPVSELSIFDSETDHKARTYSTPAVRNFRYDLTEIEIAPFTYSVSFVENLTDDDGTKLDGQIKHGGTAIIIEERLGKDVAVQTLWHEILHAFFNQAGWNEHPEDVIELISYRLVQTIRDNPKLIEVTKK